ncbi:MAG: site-specific integrase, partial [Thermodesulfobacteriota bacterium]
MAATPAGGPPTARDAHVDAFLTYLTVEKGLAANTVEAYGRDVAEFCRYLDTQGVTDVTAAGARHVVGFLTLLHDRGLSARSQARVLTTLRGLYRFLQREGLLPAQNPTALLRMPKTGRRLPHAPSRSQVAALLELPDGATPLGVRNQA